MGGSKEKMALARPRDKGALLHMLFSLVFPLLFSLGFSLVFFPVFSLVFSESLVCMVSETDL